jgi:hypothetical protein
VLDQALDDDLGRGPLAVGRLCWRHVTLPSIAEQVVCRRLEPAVAAWGRQAMNAATDLQVGLARARRRSRRVTQPTRPLPARCT